jgi:hypothetical protein
MSGKSFPVTPDGRYFVVKGQLWRCTNPGLDETVRLALVKELMAARRAVKQAKAGMARVGANTGADTGNASDNACTNDEAMTLARARVQTAKVGLGERGPVWWEDGARDFNQCKVSATPYADWYAGLKPESP